MKNRLIIFGFLLIAISACNSGDRKAPESENDIDAARNFIRSALDGRFDLVKNYMLKDSTNLQYIENVAQPLYERAPDSVTQSYKAANINVHNVQRQNDSTTIVIYSNTYKRQQDTLKVVKVEDKWLVDLKYLFQHDADSTGQKLPDVNTRLDVTPGKTDKQGDTKSKAITKDSVR